MNPIQILFSTLVLVSSMSYSIASTDVEVIYEGTDDIAIELMIKESGVVEGVVELINTEFHLPDQLRIIFGGEDGPLYDPNINEIHVPYSFIEEVKARFVAVDYDDTGVGIEDATMDALMHALFHEVAHSFVHMFDLPIVGKEEDAADSLANVLLIEFFDGGAEVVITAADLFNLESGDSDEFSNEDFWDEHSLDIQRFYATLCHIYGSNPDEFEALKDDVGFTDERAELCEEEYHNAVRSWMILLDPHMT